MQYYRVKVLYCNRRTTKQTSSRTSLEPGSCAIRSFISHDCRSEAHCSMRRTCSTHPRTRGCAPPIASAAQIAAHYLCRSESIVVVGRVSRGECETACTCLRGCREPSLRRAPSPSGGLKLIPRPVIYRALLLLMSRPVALVLHLLNPFTSQ